MLKGLILASIGFLLFLVIHVLWFRVRVPRQRFATLVRLALTGGILVGIMYVTTARDLGFLPARYTQAGWAVDLLDGLVIYVFLFFGYCLFYFLGDRGFSNRILIEINNASRARGLRQQDIAERYSMEMVLQRRLDEIQEIGRIVERDGRFINTAKGRTAARVFACMRWVWQLGEGG